MRGAGHPLDVLSPQEEETIHANVLRIVDRVGLQVENAALLDRLASSGARIDRARQRATFAPAAVEEFIASSRAWQSDEAPPHVHGGVNIYYGHYLDPRTDEYRPMSIELAREYYQVARAVPEVQHMGMLGCPLTGVPPAAEPLYERYWSWRLGVEPGGSIHRLELCPLILEMYQVHAAVTRIPVDQLFHAAVYLVPPLRLGYQEAEQVRWFLERGLRVSVGGSMLTGGATAPVTLAGMVTLAIAESLLLGLLNRALYGDRTWGISMSVTAMDPRTMMRPFGRPDMVLANLMGFQMARRYGCRAWGHSGLSDAMRPSPQAAAQKMQSALASVLVRGSVSIEMGLLGIDQVYSPIQVLLDAEIMRSLAQFTREYEVSDEAIAADLVEAIGPGGSFAGEPHTAAWFRRELWEPVLWERRPFATWHDGDGRTDLDRARERVLAILKSPPSPDAMPEEEERELRRIIERAAGRF
ncbi:MAG: trimethylamine methyltransferase family protein [Anaerolineae bacterium]|nr:trimethylamine methyltransferase family protein [Anaerolineae bacterium]